MSEIGDYHLKTLITDSAISQSVIEQRGYKTVTNKTELRELGFAQNQCSVPSLLMPVWGVSGEIVSYQHRPDKPRELIDTDKTTGERKSRDIKYESPAQKRIFLDCPPSSRKAIKDVGEPLFITEGIKKADSIVSRGACAIALLGVWNFKNDGNALLPEFDEIALKHRRVYIRLHSD